MKLKTILITTLIFINTLLIHSQEYQNKIDKMQSVVFIKNATDNSINITLYFKETDSALIIKHGDVTFKSNTLVLGKSISEEDIIKFLYSDIVLLDKSIIIVKNN